MCHRVLGSPWWPERRCKFGRRVEIPLLIFTEYLRSGRLGLCGFEDDGSTASLRLLPRKTLLYISLPNYEKYSRLTQAINLTWYTLNPSANWHESNPLNWFFVFSYRKGAIYSGILYLAHVLCATAFMLGYQWTSQAYCSFSECLALRCVGLKISDMDEIDVLSKSILP